MKLFFILITMFMNFTLSANETCQLKFTTLKDCTSVEWIYGPFYNQLNSAKVLFSINDQVENIKVIPWMVMSNHEHGSRPVVLTKNRINEFTVEKIYFMGGMIGDWYLRVQLLDQNNRLIEEQRLKLEIGQ